MGVLLGAGPGVALAMKNLFDPDETQIAKLAAYIDHTLWGSPTDQHAGHTVQHGTMHGIIHGCGHGTVR